jgi:hypothetical protein
MCAGGVVMLVDVCGGAVGMSSGCVHVCHRPVQRPVESGMSVFWGKAIPEGNGRLMTPCLLADGLSGGNQGGPERRSSL